MKRLIALTGILSAAILAACQMPIVENDETVSAPVVTLEEPVTDESALDVDVHDGDFATIQQFTTPGWGFRLVGERTVHTDSFRGNELGRWTGC